jgi:hypothetical protein
MSASLYLARLERFERVIWAAKHLDDLPNRNGRPRLPESDEHKAISRSRYWLRRLRESLPRRHESPEMRHYIGQCIAAYRRWKSVQGGGRS